jgi:hypothetical protein
LFWAFQSEQVLALALVDLLSALEWDDGSAEEWVVWW